MRSGVVIAIIVTFPLCHLCMSSSSVQDELDAILTKLRLCSWDLWHVQMQHCLFILGGVIVINKIRVCGTVPVAPDVSASFGAGGWGKRKQGCWGKRKQGCWFWHLMSYK